MLDRCHRRWTTESVQGKLVGLNDPMTDDSWTRIGWGVRKSRLSKRPSLRIRSARLLGVSCSVPYGVVLGDGSFQRSSSWASSSPPTEVAPPALRARFQVTATHAPLPTDVASRLGPLAVENVVRHEVSFPSNSIRTTAFARQVAKEGEHVPCRHHGRSDRCPSDGIFGRRRYGDRARRVPKMPKIEHSAVKRRNRVRISESSPQAVAVRSRLGSARPCFRFGKSARDNLTFVENGRAFRDDRGARSVAPGGARSPSKLCLNLSG